MPETKATPSKEKSTPESKGKKRKADASDEEKEDESSWDFTARTKWMRSKSRVTWDNKLGELKATPKMGKYDIFAGKDQAKINEMFNNYLAWLFTYGDIDAIKKNIVDPLKKHKKQPLAKDVASFTDYCLVGFFVTPNILDIDIPKPTKKKAKKEASDSE